MARTLTGKCDMSIQCNGSNAFIANGHVFRFLQHWSEQAKITIFLGACSALKIVLRFIRDFLSLANQIQARSLRAKTITQASNSFRNTTQRSNGSFQKERNNEQNSFEIEARSPRPLTRQTWRVSKADHYRLNNLTCDQNLLISLFTSDIHNCLNI